MDSLTRHLRSTVLAFTVGAWACFLTSPPREATGELLVGSFLALLLSTLLCVWCWLTERSGSGPTTRLTTGTLLKTKGWKSVGSKTACKPSALPSRASSTTGSRKPSGGLSATDHVPGFWTWCPMRRAWLLPEGELSEVAFAELFPAAHARLRTGATPTALGGSTHVCSGACFHRWLGQYLQGIRSLTLSPAPSSPP